MSETAEDEADADVVLSLKNAAYQAELKLNWKLYLSTESFHYKVVF